MTIGFISWVKSIGSCLTTTFASLSASPFFSDVEFIYSLCGMACDCWEVWRAMKNKQRAHGDLGGGGEDDHT